MLDPTSARIVTKAFVLTDIVGSTPLWRDHAHAMAEAVEQHDQFVRDLVLQHGGHLVRTKGEGDSTFTAFDSATQAVTFASELLLTLGQATFPTPVDVRLRVGIHLGEAQSRDGDYFGTTVNKAARLRAMGHPGQIVASRSVRDACVGNVPGLRWRPLGEHRPRDFELEELFQPCFAGLAEDFPPLLGAVGVPNNLPVALTSFVGREQESQLVAQAMETGRLVTLVGPGGSGKSRALLEFGHRALDGVWDGVYWIDLAPESRDDRVMSTVAEVLRSARSAGETPTQSVQRAIGAKRILLLLDNCEQVVLGCRSLAQTLLAACPGLKLATSSQVPVNAPGEALVRIGPLGLPTLPTVEALLASEAGRLFYARLADQHPDLRPEDTDTEAVYEICRKLDGIPLALELAASRCRNMSLSEVGARLDDRFRLLAQRGRDQADRHRTLRATIQWSVDLLTDLERLVFRRASVFTGGFTLDAAEAVVVAGTDLDGWDVVDALGSVADKSLIVRDEDAAGRSRYRLLESLRAFGLEALSEADEHDGLRDAHARYYLGAMREARNAVTGEPSEHWLGWYLDEHANLSSALEHSLGSAELRTLGAEAVVAMEPIWRHFGDLEDGKRWCAKATEAIGPGAESALRGRLSNAAGILAWKLGDFSSAKALYSQAIDLLSESSTTAALASAHSNFGLVLWQEGQLEDARLEMDRSLRLLAGTDDDAGRANTINNLGIIHWQAGDLDAAETAMAEALALRLSIGDRLSAAETQTNLALVFEHRGELDRALDLTSQARETFESAGSRTNAAYALFNEANLYRLLGDCDKAAQLNREAAARFEDLSDAMASAHSVLLAGHIFADTGQNSEALTAYADAVVRALKGDYAQVLREALERLPQVLAACGLGESALAAQVRAAADAAPGNPVLDGLASAVADLTKGSMARYSGRP